MDAVYPRLYTSIAQRITKALLLLVSPNVIRFVMAYELLFSERLLFSLAAFNSFPSMLSWLKKQDCHVTLVRSAHRLGNITLTHFRFDSLSLAPPLPLDSIRLNINICVSRRKACRGWWWGRVGMGLIDFISQDSANAGAGQAGRALLTFR